MYKKQNNYAFIDSQNLNLSILKCGWQLDFKKFFVFLRHKYRIEKTFVFIGYLRENQNLYNYLQKIGYTIIFKPIIKDNNGKAKGNVDAELVLHCMLQYNNFDKAIIVTGDGDFHCLIEQLERDKKLLKLIIPNEKKYSALFRKFRNYIFFIKEVKNKLECKKSIIK